jgi:hypothetical protein
MTVSEQKAQREMFDRGTRALNETLKDYSKKETREALFRCQEVVRTQMKEKEEILAELERTYELLDETDELLEESNQTIEDLSEMTKCLPFLIANEVSKYCLSAASIDHISIHGKKSGAPYVTVTFTDGERVKAPCKADLSDKTESVSSCILKKLYGEEVFKDLSEQIEKEFQKDETRSKKKADCERE